MAEGFDPYHRWLGIAHKDQPPNHYRLLGLDLFEADPEVVRDAAEQRMAHVRTCQLGPHSDLSQKILNELATAKACLLDSEKKARYDTELREKASLPVSSGFTPGSPDQADHPSLSKRKGLSGARTTEPRSRSTARRWAIIAVSAAVVIVTLTVVLTMLSSSGRRAPEVAKTPDQARELVATNSEPFGARDSQSKSTAAPANGILSQPEKEPPRKEPLVPAPTVVEKSTPPSGEKADSSAPQPPAQSFSPAPAETATPAATVAPSPVLQQPVPEQSVKKLPVPDETGQEKALAIVREVYGEEYKVAKTLDQKKALAEKILGKAAESKSEPVPYFVLLKLARDVAVAAGEVDLALQAVESMSTTFEVKTLAAKNEVFTKAAQFAHTQQQSEALARCALALVDAAVLVDQFQIAKEVGNHGLHAARESRQKELITKLVARSKEVEEIASEYDKAKAAMAVSRDGLTDPASCLVVGKYLCFMKDDWDQGIPLLAKGSDETLKTIATRELAGVSSTSDQVMLADSWWEVAEKEEGRAQQTIRQRAELWYRKAMPDMTGLAKDKVEKRLDSLHEPSGSPKQQASEGDEAAARALAAAVVGTYGVIAVEKKSGRQENSFIRLTADNSVFKGRQTIGTWKIDKLVVHVDFYDQSEGEAFIRVNKKGQSGRQIKKNGETWDWTIHKVWIVSSWKHQAGNGKASTLTLWSTGRAYAPDGKTKWTIKGKQLTLRWANGSVDKCVISQDERSYEGRNQGGVLIQGTFISNQ